MKPAARMLPKAGIKVRDRPVTRRCTASITRCGIKHIPVHREAVDVYGFRVIVRTPEVLPHSRRPAYDVKPVPKRFKRTFIAVPRRTDIRSSHGGDRSERHADRYPDRTEMNRIAEYGILRTGFFNDDGADATEIQRERPPGFSRCPKFSSSADSSEFVKTSRSISSRTASTFHPEVEIISLRTLRTPIDFAYQIHTGVGVTLPRERREQLSPELNNGDMV